MAAALLATLLVPVLRDPTTAFATHQHRLSSVEIQAETRAGSSVVTELRLVADSGLAVELTVRRPSSVTTRPTVLILGGRRTGRDVARLGDDVDNAVVAALSYPYAGEPDLPVWRARQIQRAVLDTVPAIRLATDYLLEQPYVDANRLELVGVSFGAFLVSPAAVLDERIHRLWLVHGAGQPGVVIEHALRSEVRSENLRRMLAAALNRFLGGNYFAPERWVGRIAPRPVVVINAKDDERLPRASVEALHAALQSPYRIVWMDGSHLRADQSAVIDALRTLILECVVDDDAADGTPERRPAACS